MLIKKASAPNQPVRYMKPASSTSKTTSLATGMPKKIHCNGYHRASHRQSPESTQTRLPQDLVFLLLRPTENAVTTWFRCTALSLTGGRAQ